MDTISTEKEFTDAAKDIVEFLRKKGYSKVIQLPYAKGNILSVVNDFRFFIKKDTNLFKSSFFYGLRRWLFNNEDLVLSCDLFMHNKKVAYSRAVHLLGEEMTERLLRLNIISQDTDGHGNISLISQVRIIPFNEEYFVSDPFDRKIRDFVWIGSDSILLASRLKRLNYKGKVAIDIGSGSGIQAISLSDGSDTKVIAIDINEKGLRYGKLNAAINKKANIRFVKSDMLSAIKGGVDIIVSNPPFIFLPSSEKIGNRDGYGGALGLEKIIYILKKIPQHLNPGGKTILLTLSPVISGKDILIEEIKKIFDKNYVINYEIIDYVYSSEFKNLYDSRNISYFIQGILEISKEKNSCILQIFIKDASKIKKFFSLVKIASIKAFS